jgi:hypothetical protein
MRYHDNLDFHNDSAASGTFDELRRTPLHAAVAADRRPG